ncbi:MAG: BNR/Asp-box repeat protein, partial [Bacteroidetes bacterium]|nr:BNR/Asp-box repeat protein [Bacteroidota bacterium]
YNSHPDSVGYTNSYTMSINSSTATYNYEHIPGKRPYIYDFITDGLTWFYKKVDSMSTEAPSGTPAAGGYDENPYAVDGGKKVVSDARIQASRTPDGKYVFYSWTETDTNFVTGSLKYNINPDIKVRALDVIGTPTTTPGGNGAYYVLPGQEINVSSVGNNGQIKGKSVMHYMSTTCSSLTPIVVGGTTTGSVTIPFTVSHSDNAAPPSIPFESISGIAHYFNAAKLTFTINTVGFKENVLGSVSNSYVYPNPASHSAILSIDMKDNAVVNVEVYNTIGQLVKSSKNTAQVGENNFNIDLANLSSGIYLVNVKVGNAVSTKKLIVQ